MSLSDEWLKPGLLEITCHYQNEKKENTNAIIGVVFLLIILFQEHLMDFVILSFLAPPIAHTWSSTPIQCGTHNFDHP